MDAREFITWLNTAAKGLMGKLRLKPSRAPVSPPRTKPALVKPEPIPIDSADHAEDFALRYYELLEAFCCRRMHELGIPERRIGAYDIDFDFRHAAFFPRERTGGENSPGARINLNSGVLNLDLLAGKFGTEAVECWAKGRLRDRIDAVIAHEDIEGLMVAAGEGFDAAHAAAVAQAPDTPRPISEGARLILRAMAGRGRSEEELP
jgi:hypothetical protein